ncbi:MAG: YiiX/YebB-like N1pC/P60 family cysteine hydrolase [Verrucomicrobiota bacterium JB023]|nr:YiiX/YebB-like N1pC/P60 family cysteine hydrolase [Verrucomicrobiota bacterium JB023]
MRLMPKTVGARRRLMMLCAALIAIVSWNCAWSWASFRYRPVEGDLLFQSLPNPPGLDLVDAIEGASESPYSHCGAVVRTDEGWAVLEGMVPHVKETPLDEWLRRGRGRFSVYRLKHSLRDHIPEWIAEMRKELGKPYDFYYEMSDHSIYCSELPFDAWKRVTGDEMGSLVRLGDLKWQKYREVISAIEGTEQIPLEREMITPKHLAQAKQLEFVMANGLKRE